MTVNGEAANGYKVYQAQQAATQKKVAAIPKRPASAQPINGNEVAQGYAHQDMAYAGNARAAQDDFHLQEQLGLIDKYGRPTAPHGPARSGSGGGSGHVAGPFDASPYAFDGTPYAFDGAPYDALMAAMQKGYGADQANQTSAFNALDQHLSQLSDPYAHIQPAQAAQVDPSQLSALLQSQGGNDAGLRAQAQYLQATNQSSASAQDRLAQLLSGNQQAWNQSTQSAGQLARTGASADLTAQFNALKAKLDAQKLAGQTQADRERMLAQAANDHERMLAQAAYNERNPQ